MSNVNLIKDSRDMLCGFTTRTVYCLLLAGMFNITPGNNYINYLMIGASKIIHFKINQHSTLDMV